MKHNNPEPSSKLRIKRPPLSSCRELAAEFGCTTHQLAGLIAMDAKAPRHKVDADGTVKNRWYDAKEVRKWWKARNEK